ncbi:unnamed protein product, partial [Symbiodinium necroappetens]
RDMEKKLEKLSKEGQSHTPKGMDDTFSTAPEEAGSIEPQGMLKSPEEGCSILKSPEDSCRILKCESFAVRL